MGKAYWSPNLFAYKTNTIVRLRSFIQHVQNDQTKLTFLTQIILMKSNPNNFHQWETRNMLYSI